MANVDSHHLLRTIRKLLLGWGWGVLIFWRDDDDDGDDYDDGGDDDNAATLDDYDDGDDDNGDDSVGNNGHNDDDDDNNSSTISVFQFSNCEEGVGVGGGLAEWQRYPEGHLEWVSAIPQIIQSPHPVMTFAQSL